jgi:large subunit ribosomal protein L31e
MVRGALKFSKIGKEGKLANAEAERKTVASRRNRDDKRWKRVLAKLGEKKAKFAGVGNTGKKSRVRGATRRSLRDKPSSKQHTVSCETTIHLAKLIHGKKFASRAPMAIKKIRAFAAKMFKTKDNRVDGSLNTYVWSQGVKGVPGRVRVRIERRVAENTEGTSKRQRLYTVISHVPVNTFKKLTTSFAKN